MARRTHSAALAEFLCGPTDLDETGFRWSMVVQFDDRGSGAVERDPDRRRTLGDDILERSPFVDDPARVPVDADELTAAGGPLQLLSGE